MGIFSFLQDIVKRDYLAPGAAVPFHYKAGMGVTSGLIGSFVGNPAELAMVRMSADSKLPEAQRRNYKNVVDCILRVSKEDGIPGLWRGRHLPSFGPCFLVLPPSLFILMRSRLCHNISLC